MTPEELARTYGSLPEAADGSFAPAELEGLPSAVQQHLRTAIETGTPRARTALITMSGRLRIGRWLPFRGAEVLSPHRGFVWWARAAGIVSGSDRYVGGVGELDWRLGGLIRVMHASGPDVSRSAAARAAAEAVWLPTALLPRFGVEWAAPDDDHIEACYAIDGQPMQVRYALTAGGHVRSVVFDRWGDPDGTGDWGLWPFGGEFTSHATFDGITIPDTGRLGWHYGTDRWDEGEFFRYRIAELSLHPG
jgi:hypothetical protein